jgi:hypothetical protein
MSQVPFLFDHHIVQGLVPVADAFAGGVSTDVISLANYNRVTFVIITGAREDTGISNLVTVEACSDAAAGTAVAMPFYRQSLPWSTTVDTWAAPALVAATGYNFTLNNTASNCVHICEVTADMVSAAVAGYSFVRCTIAETANKTITAAVLVILSEPRYPQTVPLTAIA